MSNNKFQIRRDVEAAWASVDPLLLEGELAYVIDANGNVINEKVGNGRDRWNDLPYKKSFSGAAKDVTYQSQTGIDGENVEEALNTVGTRLQNLEQPSTAAANLYVSEIVPDGSVMSNYEQNEGAMPPQQQGDIVFMAAWGKFGYRVTGRKDTTSGYTVYTNPTIVTKDGYNAVDYQFVDGKTKVFYCGADKMSYTWSSTGNALVEYGRKSSMTLEDLTPTMANIDNVREEVNTISEAVTTVSEEVGVVAKNVETLNESISSTNQGVETLSTNLKNVNKKIDEEIAPILEQPIQEISASVENTVGTPSVTAEVDGRKMTFKFSNIKGEQGKIGNTGPQGPQGPQGNSGYSGAAGEIEVVNDLNQGGAASVLSAEMGKELNSGHQYMGVATPSSTPKVTTAKIYYDAYAIGIYNNYGGIVINENKLHHLKWDGNTWSLSTPDVVYQQPSLKQPISQRVNHYKSQVETYHAIKGSLSIKDDTLIGTIFDSVELKVLNNWSYSVLFDVRQGDKITLKNFNFGGFCRIALLTPNEDGTFKLSDKIESTNYTTYYIVPKDGIVTGLTYYDSELAEVGSMTVERLQSVGNQLDSMYGCSRIEYIHNLSELIGISEKYAEDKAVYFILLDNLKISDPKQTAAIKLPKASVFDFNGHSISINNNSGFYFESPFMYNDDGDNFAEYPRLVYNRDALARPIYIYNNEAWNAMPLRGMFRVNDDTVFIYDLYRGRAFNKALSSFCNCRIVLDRDLEIESNISKDTDDEYKYGIASNVTLEAINNAVINGGFEGIINLRVVGNNVAIYNLKATTAYTHYTSVSVKPIREYGVVNFKFIGNKGLMQLSTSVLDGSSNKIDAEIRENELTKSGIATLTLGYLFNSEISGNIISNGTYGIILRSSRNTHIANNEFQNIRYISVWVSPGPKESSFNNELAFGCYNNIIERNKITLNKEEALSVDGADSSINVFTVDEIISTEQSFDDRIDTHPNIVKGTFYHTDDNAQYYKNGCVMVALHKDRGLRYHIIQDSVKNEDGTYSLTAELDAFNNVEIGDKYMIISPAYGNVFRDNTVTDAMTGLCIYGSSFRNVFQNNTVISTGVLKANYQMYMMSLYNSDNIPAFKSYARPIIDNMFINNVAIQNIVSMSNVVGISLSQKSETRDEYVDMQWEHATLNFSKGNRVIGNSISGNITASGCVDTTIVGNSCASVIITNCQKVYTDYVNCIDVDKNKMTTHSYIVINNTTPALYYKYQEDTKTYYYKIREERVEIGSSVVLSISKSNDSGKTIIPSIAVSDIFGNKINVTEYGLTGSYYKFEFTMPKDKCVITLTSVDA